MSLIELVAAFSEMGPAWVRWVQATIPDDTVSYARLRVLNALKCQQEGLTMTKLGEALEVTGRRVTALVDALAEHGAGLRDAATEAGEPVRRPSERRRGARRRRT